MAEKKSDASKYLSKYGGGYVTAAQFIAEKACELQAHADKKALSDRFWQTDEWKKEFLLQLRHANGLLSGKNKANVKYTPSVILSVLNSDKVRYKCIMSLGAMFLLRGLFDAAQKKEDSEVIEGPVENYDEIKVEAPRPQMKKSTNLLGKLKGL